MADFKDTCTRSQSNVWLKPVNDIHGFLPGEGGRNTPGSEMNNSIVSGHDSSGYSSPNDCTLSITQGNDSALSHTQGNDSALSHTQGNDSALSYTQGNDSALSHTQGNDSALSHTQGNDSALSNTQSNDSALSHTQGNDSALSHTQSIDSALSHTQGTDSALSHTQSIDSALPQSHQNESIDSHSLGYVSAVSGSQGYGVLPNSPTPRNAQHQSPDYAPNDHSGDTAIRRFLNVPARLTQERPVSMPCYSGNEDDPTKSWPRSKSEGSPFQENVHQDTDDSKESTSTLNCKSLEDDFMSNVSSILNGSASLLELPSMAAVPCHSHGQVEQDSVGHTEYDANEASFQTTADVQAGQETLGENGLPFLPRNDPPGESAARARQRLDQLEMVRQQNELAGESGLPASARSVHADTTRLNEHGLLTLRESDPGNEDTRDLDGADEDLEVVDGAVGGIDPENRPIPVSTDVDINKKRTFDKWSVTIKNIGSLGQPCMLSSPLQQSPQNMHNNPPHQMLSGHSSVEASQVSSGGLTSLGEAPTNQERCATCFQRPKQTRNYPCECVCNCIDCSKVMNYCSICRREITHYDII